MREKVGKDILSKKVKERLLLANQIHLQNAVLQKLAQGSMTSEELNKFIEKQGGNPYTIIPILKKSGLVEVKPLKTGGRGRSFVYSLKTTKF